MDIIPKVASYQTHISFIPSKSSPLPTMSAPTIFIQMAEWMVAVNVIGGVDRRQYKLKTSVVSLGADPPLPKG